MYWNLLSELKNAHRAKLDTFTIPFAKGDFEVAKILVQSRIIKDAQKKTFGKKQLIEIKLYGRETDFGFTDFKIMSKPSRHIYAGYRELFPIRQGYGVGVISTPQGVMTTAHAKKQKLGGEYLFQIW